MLKTLLEASARYGAGYLISVLALVLFLFERKELLKERRSHMHTLERIIDLSTASISADKDTTAALATLTRVLDSVDRRLGAADAASDRRRLG